MIIWSQIRKTTLKISSKKTGIFNTKVTINTLADSTNTKVDMVVFIDKGRKVKINKINFIGNDRIE